MQIRKTSDTPVLPTEIFDVLVGFEEEEKIEQKKRASQRSLAARRAIERHNEEMMLARDINEELWFEDI
ncbi:MAG: hypothetical protein OIF57_17075 [Marinobacterium sp.]|nr:hypothetical protein [Marinobacterium sp.]